jgi:hypothetical protein
MSFGGGPLGRFGFSGSTISNESAAYDATVVTLSHALASLQGPSAQSAAELCGDPR